MIKQYPDSCCRLLGCKRRTCRMRCSPAAATRRLRTHWLLLLLLLLSAVCGAFEVKRHPDLSSLTASQLAELVRDTAAAADEIGQQQREKSKCNG